MLSSNGLIGGKLGRRDIGDSLYHQDEQTDNFNIPYSSDDSDDHETEDNIEDLNEDDNVTEHYSIGQSTVTNGSGKFVDDYKYSQFNQVTQPQYQNIKPLPERVIKGLLTEEKIISKGIDDLIKIHSQISKTGKSTKSLRTDLIKYFNSLGMLYQALAELYDKETQRNSNILSTLNKWSLDKQEINDKLHEIKSEESGEGLKLNHLQNEMVSLNDEISKLEQRLTQMKEKRKVLKSEIIKSESIIQSRSSPYIEELHGIEAAERRKVKELSEEKSFSQENKDSTNFNISSILTKFNTSSSGVATQPNTDTVIETIARQVESFKDRTTKYKLQESRFQETTVIWQNISELLDNLEFDMQTVIASPLPQDSSTKQRIITILTQAYGSLSSLQQSLKIYNNPILNQLFQTEIGTIKQSLSILNPDFKVLPSPSPPDSLSSSQSQSKSQHTPNDSEKEESKSQTFSPSTDSSSFQNLNSNSNTSSRKPSITSSFTINKTSILPKPSSIKGVKLDSSGLNFQDLLPSIVVSSGEMSKSPPKFGADVLKESLKSNGLTSKSASPALSNKKND